LTIDVVVGLFTYARTHSLDDAALDRILLPDVLNAAAAKAMLHHMLGLDEAQVNRMVDRYGVKRVPSVPAVKASPLVKESVAMEPAREPRSGDLEEEKKEVGRNKRAARGL
jgi:hypothetical protein